MYELKKIWHIFWKIEWFIYIYSYIPNALFKIKKAGLQSKELIETIEADIIRIFDTLSVYINCNFDSDGINTKDIVLKQPAFFTKTQWIGH